MHAILEASSRARSRIFNVETFRRKSDAYYSDCPGTPSILLMKRNFADPATSPFGHRHG